MHRPFRMSRTLNLGRTLFHSSRPTRSLLSIFAIARLLTSLNSLLARDGFAMRTVLQLMEHCRSNVGRAKALFEQAFDKLILPFEFATLQYRAELVEKDIRARLDHFTCTRCFATVNPRIGIALDHANLEYFTPRRERNGQ